MKGKWRLRQMVGDLYRVGTLHILYPFLYRIYARKPVDEKKVIFLEVRQPELSDNFRLLYQRLSREPYHLQLCYLGEGREGYGRTVRNCLGVLRQMADAGYVFVNESSYFTGCLPLREETKLIQTWHACGAFKRFGYSTAEKKFGSGRKRLDRFPLHKNYSYVTVSSPEVVWAYAEAFHMEEQQERILPLGISRTDCFFQPERLEAAREKLWRVLRGAGIEPEQGAVRRKIVLYAPTFRGKVASAESPDVLDFRKLHSALGEEYIFLRKHHPFVKRRPEIPRECGGYALDVTELMEIEELLMVSDICISDYSSLVFEYALFQRPMIFLAYDLEEYYDWRGFYYPYEEMAPGPVVRTTEEVIECLKNPEQWFDLPKVRAFREKFMSGCDGQATERLVQLMKSDGVKERL